MFQYGLLVDKKSKAKQVYFFRLLYTKGRKMAAEYELAYGEPIPVIQLVTKLAGIMQEYTQSGYVVIRGKSEKEARHYLIQNARARCLLLDKETKIQNLSNRHFEYFRADNAFGIFQLVLCFSYRFPKLSYTWFVEKSCEILSPVRNGNEK